MQGQRERRGRGEGRRRERERERKWDSIGKEGRGRLYTCIKKVLLILGEMSSIEKGLPVLVVSATRHMRRGTTPTGRSSFKFCEYVVMLLEEKKEE